MLRLQKIELLGFKSFADHTEISFHDASIAAIVGPNGCGKSNISDAITWVLGEQSARSLRSGRMQDVIFNGTPGRKATGLAEVHLTLLDMDEERRGIGEQVVIPGQPWELEDTERGATTGPTNGHSSSPGPAVISGSANGQIVVSRRLFHSGESEYLMNGRPCRLRDVQELFLGTGLGPEAYAVIEQGRIGQILGSKPYELRSLIEEAAGVTKFKAKRKLAWAKLESSRQNLSRVNDILEEITRQLNSLKRQSARAERYRELRDEMRAQLRIVLVSRYHGQEQDAVRFALELSMLNRSLEERMALTESREREQRELHQLYEEEESALRRAAEERSALRLAAERARSQATAQSQQIRYLETRMEEALEEESRGSIRMEDLRSQREACISFLAGIRDEMESVAAQLKESEGTFQGCQEDLKEKERKLGELRQEMLVTVGQCATLRNQVLQLEQFLSATQRQMERAESERRTAEAELESATARSREFNAGMIRQRDELGVIIARRRALEESLRVSKQDEVQQRAALDHLRSELAGQRARMTSLQEILARRAYSTEAVKRLFETHALRKNGSAAKPFQAAIPEAQHPGNSDGVPVPAYSRITTGDSGELGERAFEPMGILADFIEVDSACESMVEEFLRDELDYIVVKDWASAKEGVRLLRAEVPGRATFLLHNGASAQHGGNRNGNIGKENGDAPLQGILGLLESRVHFTNGLSSTAGTLLPKLSRCCLVSDAETGQALARQHPDWYFLTPEGDWFLGDLVTAGKADNSGPLALKRELRELTQTLADREEAAARTAKVLAQLGETIEQQQAALRLLVEEQQEAEKHLVMAERDCKEAAEECERQNARRELAALEVERLSREAERARQRLTEDTDEISARERRRLEIETETAAIAASMTQLETFREQAHRQATEGRTRRAALDERRRASADALARIERDIEEHSARLSALHRQCEEWRQQKADLQESNLRLERDSVAAESRSEELALKLADMEKNFASRRLRLAELDQELQVRRRELEEARNRKAAAEVQLARLESELGHLKESCRNELQVEIEALMAEQPAVLNPDQLAQAEESYRQLKAKIEGLGPINMMALEEFEECRQRHDFLETQKQDLLDSIRDTTQAIEEIDRVSQAQFADAFEYINDYFQQTFETLFGGGQGSLRLTEAENPADRGVEIVAEPPGKKLQNVLLLSGGEKAMTALALLLATFRYRPSPFCLLDEVDAPLDEANIGRFTKMVQEMSRNTQFILITHSKKTMTIAPVLYGVTMQEPGVSKIVSVKFNGAAAALTNARRLAEVTV